jgi:hypothetical protein
MHAHLRTYKHINCTQDYATSTSYIHAYIRTYVHTNTYLCTGLGDEYLEAQGCTINLVHVRGKWAVITCVYNSETRTLSAYVDGELECEHKEMDDPEPGTATNNKMYIGCTPPCAQLDGMEVSQYNGSLSDVCIYSKALSAAEVSAIYARTQGVVEDAHPTLQTCFSESVCKMLVEALMRPSVDGSAVAVASTKAHVLSILSQVMFMVMCVCVCVCVLCYAFIRLVLGSSSLSAISYVYVCVCVCMCERFIL